MNQNSNRERDIKLNNKGFTLVELLVAVIILAIVITPMLHSFVTAARTNQKSKETMRATTLAENVMEEFENASVDQMLLKYAGYQDLSGNCTFSISGNQLGEYDASDYTVGISLDPSPYSLENSMNVADIEAISVLHCGVYAMSPTYDDNVYTHFEDVNHGANLINPSTYPLRNKDWFKTNTTREIEVKWINCGTSLNMSGQSIQKVKVVVTLMYTAPYGSVPDGERVFSENQEIFDNTLSLEKFQGSYLLYTPRYTSGDDVISIQNTGNVEGNMYVIREVTTAAEDATYLPSYRAKIMVTENMVAGGNPLDENVITALKLRTNLHSTIDGITSPARYYDLSYKAVAILLPLDDDAKVEKILHVQSADGRNFDNTTTGNRIYTMRVTISKDGKTLASLEGTKLD